MLADSACLFGEDGWVAEVVAAAGEEHGGVGAAEDGFVVLGE